MTPEERIEAAGLVLPPAAATPVGSYRMGARVGDVLHVAGHGAFDRGTPVRRGRLGDDLTTAQGAEAARTVMLGLLATVRAELGNLSRVRRFAKVVVLVCSTPDFHEQHLVADGATDLLVVAFGDEAGRPARTAVGVAALPLGFAVEIDAVVEVEPLGPPPVG